MTSGPIEMNWLKYQIKSIVCKLRGFNKHTHTHVRNINLQCVLPWLFIPITIN